MKYNVLKELIALSEAYETDTKTSEWRREQFITWLLNKGRTDVGSFEKDDNIPSEENLITMFIAFMYRYAQFYSRRLFKNSPLYSLEDFGVLATLFPNQQYKKSEVLRLCILEKSSGNEVLKRLLKQNLITEKVHPYDKRARLMSLTEAGKTIMHEISKGINALSNQVTGNLSDLEKANLLQILAKLHHFHMPVFERADDAEVDKILEA